jgi:hypothetical protein
MEFAQVYAEYNSLDTQNLFPIHIDFEDTPTLGPLGPIKDTPRLGSFEYTPPVNTSNGSFCRNPNKDSRQPKVRPFKVFAPATQGHTIPPSTSGMCLVFNNDGLCLSAQAQPLNIATNLAHIFSSATSARIGARFNGSVSGLVTHNVTCSPPVTSKPLPIIGGVHGIGAPRKVPSATKKRNNVAPCKCKKSNCLKLYCVCFNLQRFCVGCLCSDCRNQPTFSIVRAKAIKRLCGKKKGSVSTHITKARITGCKCKKSACLKKYCDCYQNDTLCSNACKCTGCENRNEPKKHQWV